MKNRPLIFVLLLVLAAGLCAQDSGSGGNKITFVDAAANVVNITHNGQVKAYNLAMVVEITVNGTKATVRELAAGMAVDSMTLADPTTIRKLDAVSVSAASPAVAKVPVPPAPGQAAPSPGGQTGEDNAPASAASLPKVVVTKDPDMKILTDFRQQVSALRDAGNFDELESIANEARSGKVLFGNGSSKIAHFYSGMGVNYGDKEEKWKSCEAIYKQWVEAKPKSVTARIAQADFYENYAWNARGSDYASKVTEEGWRLFKERIAQAADIMKDAKKLDQKCPMWWDTMMHVAIGQGWSRLEFDQLFEEAKAFDPQYWGYDTARSEYLMTRWYGKVGEWESATEKETERPGGIGMEVYARVVNFQRDWYSNVFRETHASWPMTREGFEVMLKKYPDSLMDLSLYCRVAWMAGDRETTRKLCEKLNGRCMVSVWDSARKFNSCQKWAYAQ